MAGAGGTPHDDLIKDVAEFISQGKAAGVKSSDLILFANAFLSDRHSKREFGDRPGKRDHSHRMWELAYKALTVLALLAIGIYAIDVMWQSAETPEEREDLRSMLSTLIPGVIGGIAGGFALGMEFKKKKE